MDRKTCDLPVIQIRDAGWPLCPICGQDELYSLNEPPTIETIRGCYYCGPVAPPLNVGRASLETPEPPPAPGRCYFLSGNGLFYEITDTTVPRQDPEPCGVFPSWSAAMLLLTTAACAVAGVVLLAVWIGAKLCR